MHNFTFSYTHYVAPPTAAQLTRFTIYGYDSYSTGNPALRKGYADNLELGWERYFDHLGSIGLSAWYNSDRDHTGTLTDVAYCDRFGRIVAFTQTANIGTARQGGIGLNATLRPLDFMNIRFYANLFDRRLSLFLNVADLFGTVRTGGSSVNPYTPSVSESTTDSRYVSFGLTWRLGRTEMESQQSHGKKATPKGNRTPKK